MYISTNVQRPKIWRYMLMPSFSKEKLEKKSFPHPHKKWASDQVNGFEY